MVVAEILGGGAIAPLATPLATVILHHSCIMCAADTGDCHERASCISTPGSFTCTCNQGYTGDGVDCSGKWLVGDLFLRIASKL